MGQPVADRLRHLLEDDLVATCAIIDADVERIASITGQTHEWVAPRGSA